MASHLVRSPWHSPSALHAPSCSRPNARISYFHALALNTYLPKIVSRDPSESLEDRTECGFVHPSKEGQGVGVQLLVLRAISSSSSLIFTKWTPLRRSCDQGMSRGSIGNNNVMTLDRDRDPSWLQVLHLWPERKPTMSTRPYSVKATACFRLSLLCTYSTENSPEGIQR